MDGASKGCARRKRTKGGIPCLARLNESKLAAGSSKGDGSEEPAPVVRRCNVVTQKQAKEWYDKATYNQRIGEGKFGETRWYDGAITPVGAYVAIKRFKDLTPLARREAEDEVCRHLQVWQNSSPECRKHLAEPAEMTFGTNPNEGTYTVQAMINEPGLRTTSLTDLFLLNRDFTDEVDAKSDWLRNMNYEDKHYVFSTFGEMLACIAEARAVHHDLHGGNVLCVTNFPKEPEDYERFARDKAELVLHWRVIDWGCAWLPGDQHTITPGNMCVAKRRGKPEWNSSFGYVSEADHTCIYDGSALDVVEELFHMFYDESGDCSSVMKEAECVTIADVAHWVREAYAAKLGLVIPAEQVVAKDQKAQEDRAVRNYRDYDEEGEEEDEEEGEEEDEEEDEEEGL